MKKNNEMIELLIPEEGLVLYPGTIYIGRTIERTETKGLVPCINGKSSVGRLGISIHATAGFGDIGFEGFWTLEIFVIQPVRVYPGVRIGQLYYEEADGEITSTYEGKYQNNTGAEGSKYFKNFK